MAVCFLQPGSAAWEWSQSRQRVRVWPCERVESIWESTMTYSISVGKEVSEDTRGGEGQWKLVEGL